MSTTATDRLDAFRDALDDAGVTHETVALDDANAAIERAVEAPAVGVPLRADADAADADAPDANDAAGAADAADAVELPASVDTDFAPSALQAATTGVTPARLGVADTGSVLVRSTAERDELVSLYPERHVAVLDARDVVADVDAAVDWLAAEVDAGRDSYVFATGASATADMGALVEGVHGPSDVHVVVVDAARDQEVPES